MHRPSDEFERDLYRDETRTSGLNDPFWQLLGLVMATFLVAGALALHARAPGVSPTEVQSTVAFGGLLVTLGGATLAGWIVLAADRLLLWVRGRGLSG